MPVLFSAPVKQAVEGRHRLTQVYDFKTPML
jgi:hypothetical protein